MKKRIITVIVSGGVVQSVEGIPEGVVVHVHDYDVDGGQNLQRDSEGYSYCLSSWEKKMEGQNGQ